MIRWIFPKIKLTENVEKNRNILVDFFEIAVLRWLIIATVLLFIIDIKILAGQSSISAWFYIICFFFTYLSIIGWGTRYILLLSEEKVEEIYHAIVGENED